MGVVCDSPMDAEGHATHVLLLTAPTAVEYVPSAHSVHASDPFPALYLPRSHAPQGPPLGPV